MKWFASELRAKNFISKYAIHRVKYRDGDTVWRIENNGIMLVTRNTLIEAKGYINLFISTGTRPNWYISKFTNEKENCVITKTALGWHVYCEKKPRPVSKTFKALIQAKEFYRTLENET